MTPKAKHDGEKATCVPSCPALAGLHEEGRCWVLWDKALCIMLEQEESILGDIVGKAKDLAVMAQEQAQDVVEFIEEGTKIH